MEHPLNGHEDHPNQLKNSHKICDETGHVILSLLEKSMETETTTYLEFPNGGKAIVEQILVSEERNNPKELDCENHSLVSE